MVNGRVRGEVQVQERSEGPPHTWSAGSDKRLPIRGTSGKRTLVTGCAVPFTWSCLTWGRTVTVSFAGIHVKLKPQNP